MNKTRIDFIQAAALGIAGLAFSAKKDGRIIGANWRINLAHVGQKVGCSDKAVLLTIYEKAIAKK